MKHKEGKKYNGFSLIELLFVIGLIIFLTAVSMPITLGFFNDQVLDEAAIALKNNIKSARAKAMAGRASGFWGVRIEEDKYVVFNGKTFEDRNSARDIPVNLPNGVSFNRPNREIIFEKDTGKPFYDSSLVGHWEMDAGEGCMGYDYSGLGNHGLLNPDCPTNSPNWVEDRKGNSGQALEFNSDTELKLPPIKFNENHYTFAYWIKAQKDNTGSYRRYLQRDGTRSPGMWFYSTSNGLHLKHRLQDGDNFGPGSLDINYHEWVHVVFQIEWDGEKSWYYAYVNGELKSSDSHPSPPHKSINGEWSTYPGNQDFSFSDFRIYERVLSAEEIHDLYQGQGNLQLNFQNNSVNLEVDGQGNVKIN